MSNYKIEFFFNTHVERWYACDSYTGCVYTRLNPGEWVADGEHFDALKWTNADWERALAASIDIEGKILEK